MEETEIQVSRIEKLGEIAGKKLTGKTRVGMKEVVEEGAEVLEDTDKGITRDAALIAASQPVRALWDGWLRVCMRVREAARAFGRRRTFGRNTPGKECG